jgi:tetrahydromethanopterin S-methyltransferase subunit H
VSQIASLAYFLALGTQALQGLAQALYIAAIAVLHALLHEAAQCGVGITMVDELVRDFGHQGIGVEVKAALRAVPA